VPVHAGDSPVAVVAVFWRKPLPELPVQTDALLELLSAEAAVALERTGLIARLETLSRTDGLTGLANRRMLDDEAAREVARAHRSDEPLSVVMLDLDHFKAFNDEHGHQSGDRLLKETASAWRSLMRASDLLARYGGEEFVLVLPTCPGHEALALAARLRDAMPLQQSCSAGVAQLREGETAAELVARADRLLYSAKAAGRDCAVIDED
jgi:diguanylate cyclase (GGDEF)-like protein